MKRNYSEPTDGIYGITVLFSNSKLYLTLEVKDTIKRAYVYTKKQKYLINSIVNLYIGGLLVINMNINGKETTKIFKQVMDFHSSYRYPRTVLDAFLNSGLVNNTGKIYEKREA